MFDGAATFNQPLDWVTTNVQQMEGMFKDAVKFNGPIMSWDTSNVQNMIFMFWGAVEFDQPLDPWVTSKVTSMANMFLEAAAFNQPLNSWDTSRVSNLFQMFKDAAAFSQCLASWDTSAVTNQNDMFDGSGCPADAAVLENGLLDCGCPTTPGPDHEDCGALLDYSLFSKKAKQALITCRVNSLIQSNEFIAKPPWRRRAGEIPWLAFVAFVCLGVALLAFTARAWRSNRRLSYEEL